jgi:transcriptional regulator with GAF, ATPase, and Fis domain
MVVDCSPSEAATRQPAVDGILGHFGSFWNAEHSTRLPTTARAATSPYAWYQRDHHHPAMTMMKRNRKTTLTTASSAASSSTFSLSDDLPDDPSNAGSRGALNVQKTSFSLPSHESYTTSTTMAISGTSEGSTTSFSTDDLLLDDPSNDGSASCASLRGLNNIHRGSSKNACFRPSQLKSNSLAELTINKLTFDKIDICGRDAEVKQLNKALKDVKQKKQLVLLAGYSGTGT